MLVKEEIQQESSMRTGKNCVMFDSIEWRQNQELINPRANKSKSKKIQEQSNKRIYQHEREERR